MRDPEDAIRGKGVFGDWYWPRGLPPGYLWPFLASPRGYLQRKAFFHWLWITTRQGFYFRRLKPDVPGRTSIMAQNRRRTLREKLQSVWKSRQHRGPPSTDQWQKSYGIKPRLRRCLDQLHLVAEGFEDVFEKRRQENVVVAIVVQSDVSKNREVAALFRTSRQECWKIDIWEKTWAPSISGFPGR